MTWTLSCALYIEHREILPVIYYSFRYKNSSHSLKNPATSYSGKSPKGQWHRRRSILVNCMQPFLTLNLENADFDVLSQSGWGSSLSDTTFYSHPFITRTSLLHDLALLCFDSNSAISLSPLRTFLFLSAYNCRFVTTQDSKNGGSTFLYKCWVWWVSEVERFSTDCHIPSRRTMLVSLFWEPSLGRRGRKIFYERNDLVYLAK